MSWSIYVAVTVLNVNNNNKIYNYLMSITIIKYIITVSIAH